MDAATIAAIASSVEAEYPRIVDDLAAAGVPPITAVLHPDREAFASAVTPFIGPVPAFATGSIVGPDRIHVVSPNARSVWPYERGVAALVHEFAHCASLRLNPALGNNPRWLWEAVAVYEARQFVNPRDLPYVTAGGLPPFEQLNAFDNTRIYDVGYVLIEFIREAWGRDGLLALIRARGDLAATLPVTEAELRARWLAWVQSRYL